METRISIVSIVNINNNGTAPNDEYIVSIILSSHPFSSLPLFFYPRSSSPFSSPPSDMMNVFVAVTIKEYSAANLMKNTSRSWLFRRLCSSRLRYKYHYHSNYDSSFVLPSLSPRVKRPPRPKDSYDAIRTAPNEFILWRQPPTILMNDYVFQLHPFTI